MNATIQMRFRTKDGLEGTEFLDGYSEPPTRLKRVLTVPLERSFFPHEQPPIETRTYQLQSQRRDENDSRKIFAVYHEI